LGLCAVAYALDAVIIATVLSTISETFDTGAVISWVPAAFLLTSTSFQPLFERFSDIFGKGGIVCVYGRIHDREPHRGLLSQLFSLSLPVEYLVLPEVRT
jgi:MFS family permease